MIRPLLLAMAGFLAAGPALATPKVIASILPVDGIVAAVMGSTGQPELLLQGKLSEHRAVFTPEQIAELGTADVVFIIGQGLEAKLSQLSGTEAVNGKRFVELSMAPGVRTLPIREGGVWEGHEHDHDHEDGHSSGETEHTEGVLRIDPHVWLDPENAKAMAKAVAEELAKADPAHAATYRANAEAFGKSVDETAAAIAAELAPVKGVPYAVFHDAYRYFEERFGLTPAGSIADVSAQAPSAERLAEVRNKIVAVKAACVFREPQYDSRVVATVIEGTGAREGVLDPIGADIPPGAGAYQQLLRNLGRDLTSCLAG
jgi:zinc transport system substrate-binding protein